MIFLVKKKKKDVCVRHSCFRLCRLLLASLRLMYSKAFGLFVAINTDPAVVELTRVTQGGKFALLSV